MNGWEFIEEYSKLTEEKKAKIVLAMQTTSLNPDDENLARQKIEIVEFIHKPVRQADIENLIKEYFNK